MSIFHKELANGRWFQLSLVEQMGNIGGEVYRAMKHQGDQVLFQKDVERALELFDLTLLDSRWRGRRWEIARAREVFCDAAYNDGRMYKSTLSELVPYFDWFAMVARSRL